ncbi:MAG TPA: uroporphyrinogen-III C-methyltransferase [Rhodanobacter sp.]|nr:uroporphyrinogen-III C-methyltransferase [Rhodanobacter sp.]
MSNADQPHEPAAPERARPDPIVVEPSLARPPRAAPPRPRGGGSLALALLLALLALLLAGYVGWRQWQQLQGSASASSDVAQLQQRVGALETNLAGVSSQRASLAQQLDDAAAVNRSMRDELLGQAERMRNLEDAVAKLAEKSLSGHDAMLLDETESLLRMGAERYTLFHDAQGAAAAYALADQTLAAVNDGAFSGVRQSIEAERDALAKSQPVSQASALQQLTTLRDTLAGLPLKPLDTVPGGTSSDAWSRIRRALGSVVNVQRDDGAPLAVADARFARELAALDLAQAQAALLAHDREGYEAALRRASASLASQFDDAASSVQQARKTLDQLVHQLPASTSVQLGAALTELRNLRAVHALNPAGADSAALPAATSHATAKGRVRP